MASRRSGGGTDNSTQYPHTASVTGFNSAPLLGQAVVAVEDMMIVMCAKMATATIEIETVIEVLVKGPVAAKVVTIVAKATMTAAKAMMIMAKGMTCNV